MPQNVMIQKQLEAITQKPGHCYIFAGPIGSGKMAAAQRLASSLTTYGSRAQSHNITTIEPERVDGQIKITQIRDVIESLSLKPLEAHQHRVIIVYNVHSISKEAANAFLKILEEPPANTTFFLISSRLASILPTIRSRAQIIRFTPPAKKADDTTAVAAKFYKGSLTKRFAIAKQYHEARDTKTLLAELYEYSNLDQAAKLMKCENALRHNVNGRLVFEWLALELGQ